ncbi:MAG TPA: uroporphyrinogen-III C-methyltransferase [Burkholderiales bacterium]|nr:uroporphyrinogen-III C-methyltransferase [Burkholderiales bacterium]
MNDTTTQPAPASPPQGLPATAPAEPGLPPPASPDGGRAPSRRSLTPALAMLLAIVAIGLIGFQWYTSRSSVESLRNEVAKKLSDGDTVAKESRVVSEQAREASAEAQVKIGVLESRLAESQSQQIALESLYQELSRNRDEWAFADIEQSLLIASQQLQLAGNVKAALIALQNADARLQRMDRPQFTVLRKAISRDIDRLKALPHVDTVGLSVRLDNVINAVDTLPLAMDVRPPDAVKTEPPGAAPTSAWQRFLGEAWSELKQLVRVQQMDRPEIPLLAPPQAFFLRENLKLRLLGARLALLARDQANYKSDLKAAREWIIRFYDTREKSVGTTLGTLRNLHESDISIDMPDVSSTLDALRNLRIARDRPVR